MSGLRQEQAPPAQQGAASGAKARQRRVATHRGRVKQKGVKCAELLEVGTLGLGNGWHNSGVTL